MTDAKRAQNEGQGGGQKSEGQNEGDGHGQNEAVWLEVALDAARAAGELAKKGWRRHPASTHKGRIDLVTQFDLDSEKLLRERLSARTPFAVVGEEGGGERAKEAGGLTWYVDPIDGTTNFVHGHPFWCVSVGLFAGNTPVLGVVVAPSLGVEWLGITSLHTTRNGELCTVSTVDSFRESLLATGFPDDRHVSEDNNFDAFVAIKKQCQAVRRCGSAAIDMCFVADGTYDGYWEKKVKPWDVAAGSAIVLGAGGKITDYEGNPSDLANGQMVATNGRIHGSLIAELNALYGDKPTA